MCSSLPRLDRALALDGVRSRHSPLADALSDLTLLDGALARLAAALQMHIDDHDTGQGAGDALRLDERRV